MSTKTDFYNFVKPGFVSVWVGDFRSEDDFDDHLNNTFPTEFGFEIPPQAPCEIGVKPEPVEIEQLVQGFSRSKTFDSKVVESARARGISMASCMFIIYNFEYDMTHQSAANLKIKFIGSVPFPGF